MMIVMKLLLTPHCREQLLVTLLLKETGILIIELELLFSPDNTTFYKVIFTDSTTGKKAQGPGNTFDTINIYIRTDSKNRFTWTDNDGIVNKGDTRVSANIRYTHSDGSACVWKIDDFELAQAGHDKVIYNPVPYYIGNPFCSGLPPLTLGVDSTSGKCPCSTDVQKGDYVEITLTFTNIYGSSSINYTIL